MTGIVAVAAIKQLLPLLLLNQTRGIELLHIGKMLIGNHIIAHQYYCLIPTYKLPKCLPGVDIFVVTYEENAY